MEKPVSDTLREVKLRLMNAKACKCFLFYNHNLQICVGNPRKRNSAYKVPHPIFLPYNQSLGDSVLLGGSGGVRKSPSIVNGVCIIGF